MSGRYRRLASLGRDDEDRSARGFTLIEVIVVMVILVGAAALVVPNLFHALQVTKVKTAAKEMAAAFRYARTRAIGDKVFTEVRVDLDTNVLTFQAAQVSIPKGSGTVTLGDGDEESPEAAPDEEVVYADQPAPPAGGGAEDEGMRTRKLPPDLNITFQALGEDELYDEGYVVMPFGPKGNSLGGIFYVTSGGYGFQIWVDPLVGRIYVDQLEEQ